MTRYSQDYEQNLRIEDEYPHGACEWCNAHLTSDNPDACPCFQDEADKDEADKDEADKDDATETVTETEKEVTE